MSILIYATAVAVWIILARQNRRHEREIVFEMERAGIVSPQNLARGASSLLSGANVALGLILTLSGVVFVWLYYSVSTDVPTVSHSLGGVLMLGIFFLGGGVALIVLGTRAFLTRRRLKRT